MNSHPLPLILIAAVTLSACGLDALEGKETSRQAYEHRQSMIMQPAAEATTPAPSVASASAAEAPIVAPVTTLATVTPVPVLVVAPPPCVEVFRVTRCVDGQAVDWSM